MYGFLILGLDDPAADQLLTIHIYMDSFAEGSDFLDIPWKYLNWEII